MINLEILSTIFFFLIIAVLLIKDRKNIELKYGIIIRKWERGKELIDEFVSKHKKLLLLVGNLAIVIGILASVSGLFLLLALTLRLEQAFGIVLPTVAGMKYPEPVVSIPFWYWLVGIFVVIVSHETMHAFFSRLEKVKIKSYGIILFLLFPIGAFVDPDMKMVEKLKSVKKMRIFAAGSFGNFLVALLIILLTLATVFSSEKVLSEVGIKFEKTIAGTPAHEVELKGIIQRVDNQTIKNIIGFSEAMNKTKPGENITITTTEGMFRIQTIEHPELKGRSFIGIENIRTAFEYKLFSFKGIAPDYLIDMLTIWLRLLFWLFFLNVGVGIANMLPMKPFDGGYIFEEIFKITLKEKYKVATYALSIITFGLILMNLFGIRFIRALT